jgi:MFS family permease
MTGDFWRAAAGNFTCLVGYQMSVLLPGYLARHGMERWEIGVSDGAFWTAAVLSQPWLGPSLDRHGPRVYYLGGALAMSVLAATFPLLPVRLPEVLLARAVQGFCLAMYFTAIWSHVASLAGRTVMVRTLGVFGISGLIPGAVGPLAAEALVRASGYPGMFDGMAASYLLGALVLSPLRAPLREPTPDGAPVAGSPPDPGGGIGSAAASHGAYQGARGLVGRALSPALRAATLVTIGFGTVTGTLHAFVAPFVGTLGLDAAGWMFACYTFASVVVRLTLTPLGDRTGPGPLIVPSLLLISAGIAGISRLDATGWRGLPLLLAGGILAGAGHGLLYPALAALFVQRLGAGAAGRAMSAMSACINLGGAMGASLSGLAAHVFGYPAMFLVVALSIGLVAGAFPLLEARATATH